MKEYPKIQTIFKRCQEKGPNRNKVIYGDWTKSEFEALKDVKWEATEKIDGTNICVNWDGEIVTFGGREDNAQIPAKLVNYLVQKFNRELFVDMPPMTLYGEGYGAGIQKVGKMYGEDQRFILFDVVCGGLWLERKNVEDIANKLDLRVVEIMAYVTLDEAIECVKVGAASALGKGTAEGLVLRAPCGLLDRQGNRLICKIKTRDFG